MVSATKEIRHGAVYWLIGAHLPVTIVDPCSAVVCHSSPRFRQSPFRKIRQKCILQTQVEIFDELFEVYAPQTKISEGRTNLFGLPKSSFGRGKMEICLKKGTRWHTSGVASKSWAIGCSPNEDFGSRNKRSVVHFYASQTTILEIENSRPWKVLQKRTRNSLFTSPKSSFGEHKLAYVTTQESGQFDAFIF